MIARFTANALALALVTWLLPGISMPDGSLVRRTLTIVVVAAVFGVLNALVKPVFEFFTGCLILVTLGLFVWVINACMLMLTSYLCTRLGYPWHVDTWVTAIIGSVVISLVSTVLAWMLKKRDHR